MKTDYLSEASNEMHTLRAVKPCPECGCEMKQAEQVDEGDFKFIWYECSRQGCDGQWLQKLLL